MRHAYNAVLHVYNVQDEARKKSFQSLSGIGGLSDRSLAKVVQWIRDHPEVAVARYVALSLATRCGNYRISIHTYARVVYIYTRGARR